MGFRVKGSKLRCFKIVEPVFKIEPLFIVNCTAAEAHDHILKHFHIDQDMAGDISGTMLTFNQVPWRVVWIHRGSDIPVAAHEIFHLVTRIMQDKGIRIVSHDESGHCGDETAAYLLEFLIHEYLKELRRR